MAGGDLGRAGETGSELELGSDLPPGTVLGKYRIVQLIGRGGMGVVYRVEHVELGMLRALKTLAGELAHHPLARSRFLKEAKAAAQINHPHVVKVFDCGEHDGVPFFIMEHLEGEDLERAVDRTSLTVEQIVGIMLAVCAAIAEMHSEGLIHRDLKPGNIFLARNKLGDIVPTVLDFGIARPIEREPSATRTQDGAIVGTANYTSPEQLADLPAGECTDQYALGVTLYRCATGALPFAGESALAVYRRIAAFQFPRPRDLRPELPVEFEDLVLRAMNERPADRFDSVYDVGKALLRFASAKHRAVWTDYYSRVRSPRGIVSMAIPVVGSAGWLLPQGPGRPTEVGQGPNGTAVMPPMVRTEHLPNAPPMVRTEHLPAEGMVPAVGGTEPLPVAATRTRLDAPPEAKISEDPGRAAHWRSLVRRAVLEFLLRAQGEWRWDASSADTAVFRNASEFTSALGRNKYDQVVVYCHGNPWSLVPIDKPGTSVREYALAKALAEAGVKAALLLGCKSKRLAETAARVAENAVRIGGIEPDRDDYADKRRLEILNTIIWGYGGER